MSPEVLAQFESILASRLFHRKDQNIFPAAVPSPANSWISLGQMPFQLQLLTGFSIQQRHAECKSFGNKQQRGRLIKVPLAFVLGARFYLSKIRTFHHPSSKVKTIHYKQTSFLKSNYFERQGRDVFRSGTQRVLDFKLVLVHFTGSASTG